MNGHDAAVLAEEADGSPGQAGPGLPGLAALLMLGDGRFPSGSHAHSGGLEAAAAAGRVTDVPGLKAFLQGRVATSGVIAAAFAAAACAGAGAGPRLAELDAEFEARTPAPALRATSRKLGRQLLRTARAARPDPRLDALAASWPQGAHQPLVLGVTARAFALTPHAAAAAALHDAVTGPATSAVRLLGLDPFQVQAVLAGLTPHLDRLARDAADHASKPAADLPSPGSPLLDISAQHHATWEVRLFAS